MAVFGRTSLTQTSDNIYELRHDNDRGEEVLAAAEPRKDGMAFEFYNEFSALSRPDREIVLEDLGRILCDMGFELENPYRLVDEVVGYGGPD